MHKLSPLKGGGGGGGGQCFCLLTQPDGAVAAQILGLILEQQNCICMREPNPGTFLQHYCGLVFSSSASAFPIHAKFPLPAGPAYYTTESTETFHSGQEPWLSAYMPNVMYHDTHEEAAQNASGNPMVIKGLAFVAVREIRDEEILLNYRLNPQVQKPAWYSPVDLEEDTRRWY